MDVKWIKGGRGKGKGGLEEGERGREKRRSGGKDVFIDKKFEKYKHCQRTAL